MSWSRINRQHFVADHCVARRVTVPRFLLSLIIVASSFIAMPRVCSAQSPSFSETFQPAARQHLLRVINFYRSKVGYQGAYLWRYSADLKHQEGEEAATATSGWTQPPGTPAVGEAFLNAYRVCGEAELLNAATEVAHALVRSQLQSGGWASHFDLQSPGRDRYAYRIEGKNAGKQNYTTFDDDKTQSALRCLMHVDEVLNFEDQSIHEAVEYALKSILAVQYPNGAWPQQYKEPAVHSLTGSRKASYPENWSREYVKRSYRHLYTLNDNNMSKIIDTLMEAYRIYERQDCYEAVTKTGEFFLLAQMPNPQPGWAQQYDSDMHPAWARRFEPPAITGGESQSVMRSLIGLTRFTGDSKFVETLPAAIQYYRRSALPDGRLARFYELRSNRPLYFDRNYKLTYDNTDVPTHYAFVVSSRLDSIEKELQTIRDHPNDAPKQEHRYPTPLPITPKVQTAAQKVINQLDARGAWVERSSMRHTTNELDLIDMRTFARNLATLARYVGATNPNK
ncbi:MAG: pectate lyase [Rubripirellula sp.]|nr:pectate lyase [Rubripirellula sp.]